MLSLDAPACSQDEQEASGATTTPPRDTRPIARRLQTDGWEHLSPAIMLGTYDLTTAQALLRPVFADLPADTYCRLGVRRRRLALYSISLHDGVITDIPPYRDAATGEFMATYLQLAAHNPDHGGAIRQFPCLDDDIRNHPFIYDLIRACHTRIAWGELPPRASVIAGLHLVTYAPSAGHAAVASPDCFHHDGEPYTFTILFEREALRGGRSFIGRTPETINKRLPDIHPADILDEFTLIQPFTGFAVNDRLVTHYIEPMATDPAAARGYRSVFLIDFKLDG